jgi:hypothetical protein
MRWFAKRGLWTVRAPRPVVEKPTQRSPTRISAGVLLLLFASGIVPSLKIGEDDSS